MTSGEEPHKHVDHIRAPMWRPSGEPCALWWTRVELALLTAPPDGEPENGEELGEAQMR